jgi:deoxyribonuclease IV
MSYDDRKIPMTIPANKTLIGAHTSIAGGVYNALTEGQLIGATTVQIFTSNQKRWQGKPITPDIIEKWERNLDATGIQEVMSHDSYLINLGAPNQEILQKSRQAFKEEAARCVQLNISYLNFHPGSALESDPQACMDLIVESLLEVEPIIAKSHLRLLLEATAGQGSNVGHRFEQLAYIIERIQGRIPIGVCIDTCHIFAAGYDIRTPETFDATLKEFDHVVGLKHLYAFHLNDSAKGLGSRVDRHRPLGEGEIGIDCFKFIMNDPRTRNINKYLETPDGPPLWIKEIAMLRGFI